MSWIRLHRQIKSHWIWSDPKRLQWWIDILLCVNHAKNRVLIKGKLIDCARGQSVKSLDTWASEWKTTKKTVANFFKMLEKDRMITIENVTVSTRITVCKYDSYNGMVNADDTAHYSADDTAQETHTTTHSKRTLPPNNNDKEDKEDKEYSIAQFPFFWDAYGKKVDREKCFKKFKTLKRDEIEAIKRTLTAYLESTPEIQFRKNPLTYLNGKCWNDQPATPPPPTTKMVF